MRVSIKICCLVVLLLVATCAIPRWTTAAEENASPTIPKIVLVGLDAYKASGANAAMKAWLKGSPLENEKQATSQVAIFKQIESYYGSYKSYEIAQIRELSTSTKIVYLVMNFEKGPVFTSFVCYKTEKDWIIPDCTFNTKAETIFPWLRK